MNRETEIKEQIAEVMRRNTDRLHGHRVFLFGSRATGDARPHSDFDIGVVGESPLPLSDFYAIEEQLDDLPTLYKQSAVLLRNVWWVTQKTLTHPTSELK